MREVSGNRSERLHPVPQTDCEICKDPNCWTEDARGSVDREGVEMFLQEASEHLQYLAGVRECVKRGGHATEDLERLIIAAHTLSVPSASYGFPRFSEIAGKLAHVFQYSLICAARPATSHGPV